VIPTHFFDLTTLLVDAHATARPVPSFFRPAEPDCLEDGYGVQGDVWTFRGRPTAGYKIGLTSAAAQTAFGAADPIVGRLAASDLVHAPASIHQGPFPLFAEAEITFVIGDDFPASAAPFDEADVLARIESAHASIELCLSRYGWEDVSLAELIADNSNAGLLVIGDRLRDWRSADLQSTTVTLRRHGHDDTGGSTGAVLGDPRRAITWLANWLAERGEGLRAGQVVASGSCTGVTPLGEIEHLVADFGLLGQACVTIGPDEKNRAGASAWTSA